jgi:hypothetical protein
MSLINRCNTLFALLAFATVVPVVAQLPAQTAPNSNIVTARIKLDEQSMIIVPVTINGSGPYDFLLDTGCAKTIVDQKLAAELSLPHFADKNMVGVMASALTPVVHINTISIGGATVAGGDVLSSKDTATGTVTVRGVLGEDFLQNFDVLIDYRHQVIRLDAPLGSMGATASGERLPVELSGIYHGQPSHNRLVLSGHIPELGDAPMSLLLDSAASHLTLFQKDLGKNSRQQLMRIGTINQAVEVQTATLKVQALSLGKNFVPNVTVIALDRRADTDTDGVVPTSFFKSVLISSRGGFAILNPSFPNKALEAGR